LSDLRNIAIIVVDTMRAPSTFGQPGLASMMPFYQSLVDSGTAINRFLASSSWTLPSHQALLCGEEPWKTPLESIRLHSERRRKTLSRIWSEAGGESFAVSQNPIVNVQGGVLQGFDYGYPGPRIGVQRLLLMAGNRLDRWTSFSQIESSSKFLEFRESSHSLRHWAQVARQTALPFATALSTASVKLRSVDRSLVRLKKFLREARPGRPLLMFLNVMEAHEPYLLSVGGMRGSRNLIPAPTNSLAAHSSTIVGLPVMRQEVHEGYFNGLQSADKALAKIFAFLYRHIDMGRTLVIVVSDHGQALGERGYYGHGSYLHDELVHVPCLVWGKTNKLQPAVETLGQNWVDHLHLHDFISKTIEGGGVFPTRQQVNDIVQLRGTATSFVRSHSNDGAPGPTPTGGVCQIRIETGDSYAIVEERLGAMITRESVGAEREELIDKASRTLLKIHDTLGRQSEPEQPSVDSRLSSWGY
jgi:arylsulfatase A-like enzyme